MVKILVMYGNPTDVPAFEDHYANTHLPLAAKIPNVSRFEASRIVANADGSPPDYYRVAELWFDSQEEMQAALGTSEGQATTADIPTFATGGATILIAEVD
jgi:uncharacterized protein (TIGR02118 family)